MAVASSTVGDYLLDRFRQWGVEKVLAYPGDGINSIVAAFGKAENQLCGRRLRLSGEIFS